MEVDSISRCMMLWRIFHLLSSRSLKNRQLKKFLKRKKVQVHVAPAHLTQDTLPGITCSTQNVRSTASCIGCWKPTVIYSKHKFTQRQKLSLPIAVSTYEYTCGSFVLPPSSPLQRYIALRPQLPYPSPVEIPYFSADLGRKNLCAYCGIPEAVTDAELKKS